MPKPSVFVSSTFVDLRHVRERLAQFIESIGYSPRLFEKGGIGFDYQKPFDESCYQTVEECDMFVLVIGGRYGSPASDSVVKSRLSKYNSITRNEYIKARESNIPIYIFVDKDVFTEHKTYLKNKEKEGIIYAQVDNILIFDLIDDIYRQNFNNYIYQFSNIDDIIEILKSQWAALVHSYIRSRATTLKINTTKINSFKLFYYRDLCKKSIRSLASDVESDHQIISRLERLKPDKTRFDGYHMDYFPECEFSLLSKIESKLNCVGKLTAGQSDDFLAMYVEYYGNHKGIAPHTHKPRHPMLKFQTKTVVFDFDGTITMSTNGMTTWEMIWTHLGYKITDCAEYHTQYRRNLITHEEWCNITLDRFRIKRFSSKMLSEIAGNVKLIPGLPETIDDLTARGIKIYILSGSIRELIRIVLGDLSSSFEQIKANEMKFDKEGIIQDIIGTKYDFEGKDEYIRNLVRQENCSPMDILFVGNAGNDEWASKSGARTLCVNPSSTDPDNPKIWTENIRKVSDLRDILKHTL